MSTSELSGSWTYRSFNPRFVTGNETPQEAALIVADRVVLTLNPPVPRNVVDGTIEWEGGGLVLKGLFARQQAIMRTSCVSTSWALGVRAPILPAGNTVTWGI